MKYCYSMLKITFIYFKCPVKFIGKSCKVSFFSLTFLLTQRGTWFFIMLFGQHLAFSLNFRDRAFFYCNIHSYNYSNLVQIWCQSLLLDLWPLRSRRKCVSWLTAGWRTRLQPQHLVLPNWGDSFLDSLWKLTAKHSQLDLCYLERLSFSPWIKAGLDKTCTLRCCSKLMWSWWPASKPVHLKWRH